MSWHKAKCVEAVVFLSAFLLILYLNPAFVRYLKGPQPMKICPLATSLLKQNNSIDASLKLRSRLDIQTCTDWGAPIIWDGMFDHDYYDQEHRRRNSAVALTVFAVGRYLETYLEDFLRSAERHFMVGLPVTYYVFTDAPSQVPAVPLAPGRSLQVMTIQRHARWQDVSMMRMRAIADAIDSHIRHSSSHVFCLDVDQVFAGRFGSEALGESVASLHAYYYREPQKAFTYDRNPGSRAYMTYEDGDFYYHAAVFGGTWRSVRRLAESCHRAIMEDKSRGVEALWHDESHLNKYLWLHKPSKLLSPEYCWASDIGQTSDIRVTRLLWAEKKYGVLRDTLE